MFLLYQGLWNFYFFSFSDETLFLVKSYLEAQHIKQRCTCWMGAGGEGELQVYSPHLPWPPEFFGDTPRECLRFSGATYDTCNNHSFISFIRLFFSPAIYWVFTMCQALFEMKGIHTALNKNRQKEDRMYGGEWGWCSVCRLSFLDSVLCWPVAAFSVPSV